MAKAKRKSRVSKGLRPSIAKVVLDRNPLEAANNKVDAWRKGQNPWVTVPNPDADNRREPFIKVKANKYWGNPKAKGENGPKGNLVVL